MKINKIYLLALCVSALFTSCDLDINTDPTTPDNDSITPDLLFPSVQNFVAAASCDVMFNYAGFFAQYYDQMPDANQFNGITWQNITESDQTIDRAYSGLFAGALQDIEDIKSKTSNTADLLAATALRAFSFQLLVDNMSECPYSEALQGSANTSPAWDNGEDVYAGILAELDAAMEAYEAEPELMTMTDMMFGMDVDQWIGYVNALRLRMYIRMYDYDNSVLSKITALVEENNFFTGDAAVDAYGASDGNYSPFYNSYYSLGTANHCAAYPIVSYMLATSDARIEYAISKSVNDDEYVGQMPGAKMDTENWTDDGEWGDEDVSAINYALFDGSGTSRKAFIFTQANLQFLIAEVEYRFNNDSAAAKAAYEAAVTADFAARGISGAASFLTGSKTSWDSASDKLELIYMQKWVALFYMDHMEAWSEIRRTDVPALSSSSAKNIYADSTIYSAGDLIEPSTNALGSGKIFKRMFYSYTARSLNKNTPSAKSADTKVWWDVE
ncbi:MAG: SusD/RagB family nutrient-binding outer membrane lipoprotein [Rikenellaceae bacterium]